jgi:hypothetical protein
MTDEEKVVYIFALFRYFWSISKDVAENKRISIDDAVIFFKIIFLPDQDFQTMFDVCNYLAKPGIDVRLRREIYLLLTQVHFITEWTFDGDLESEQFQKLDLINSIEEDLWRKSIRITTEKFSAAYEYFDSLCPKECEFVREDSQREYEQKLQPESCAFAAMRC